MNNTVNKYLGYSLFSNLVFQKSIFMIFLTTQKGVTVAQLSILEVSLLLGIFVTEVPAGFLGDKFGRKVSVCTGLIFLAISSIGFLFFSAFNILITLFILEGAGMAFISGADQSLLYESLKEENQEEKFLPTLSKAMTLSYVALALAAIIGGTLQRYSWNLVYGLTSLMIVISMFFVFGIYDNHNRIDEKKMKIGPRIISFIKEKNGKAVFKIYLVMAIFEGSAMSFIMFSQQFFHIIGTKTVVISILMTVGRFLSGGAIFVTPKLSDKFATKKIIKMLMLITCSSFFINILQVEGLYFLTFFVLTSLPYICNVLNLNFIHKLVPSEIRTSTLSIGNAISSIFLGICYLIVGIVLSNYDLLSTVLVLGLVNAFSVILYLIISKKF